MKRLFFIVICFGFLVPIETKAQDPDEVDSTNIWIEQLVFDFDTIQEGDSITLLFKIINTGKNDFVVRQVFPSCGCSVVDFRKTPTAPNDSLMIQVVFDSEGKKGAVENTFEMFSNANGGHHVFYLRGYVNALREE